MVKIKEIVKQVVDVVDDEQSPFALFASLLEDEPKGFQLQKQLELIRRLTQKGSDLTGFGIWEKSKESICSLAFEAKVDYVQVGVQVSNGLQKQLTTVIVLLSDAQDSKRGIVNWMGKIYANVAGHNLLRGCALGKKALRQGWHSDVGQRELTVFSHIIQVTKSDPAISQDVCQWLQFDSLGNVSLILESKDILIGEPINQVLISAVFEVSIDCTGVFGVWD